MIRRVRIITMRNVIQWERTLPGGIEHSLLKTIVRWYRTLRDVIMQECQMVQKLAPS
jgi:hypothetical protein